MTNKHRQILVTSALPYANGSLHIGYMVEAIQTDIFVRYQRLLGNVCYYVCADDTHGTPTMLKAQREGISPEDLVAGYHKEHQADLRDFYISQDNFYTTHSDENRELSNLNYSRLRDAGHITHRTIKQFYDPVNEMFLPDRFIRGECPNCHAQDQYGDQCEVCNRTHSPTDLINPVSAISGATPIEKESEHLFFKLPDFEQMLKDWTRAGHLQPEVVNKLDEWFDAGLREWDISRDAPYFGFEIPDQPGKYFYVWLDAPIGYLASFMNLCDKQGIDYDAFIRSDSDADMYHFIGKDITYFHALFWPATLHFAGYRTPDKIFVHGFLTVNGQKMSKSRGTFITARSFLEHLDPEYLRYYFAAKLSDRVEDIDLNLDDFILRVNSNLIGKYINIASRTAGFISKRFAGRLAATLAAEDKALLKRLQSRSSAIADCYEQRRYSEAVREIMDLADEANEYINAWKPWELARDDKQTQRLHQVCTTSLNVFRILTLYLKPILPQLSNKIEAFMNITPLDWEDVDSLLLDHVIHPYSHLARRIENSSVDAMLADNRSESQTDSHSPHRHGEAQQTGQEEHPPMIEYDDFARIDLRVARIIRAEQVEGADKLLRLQLDIGNDETRQVFAGIKTRYSPDELQGRLTVVVANLAPRKMRFGVSEGMVLAAGPGGEEIWLIAPDDGASPGMQVK